MNGYSTSEFVLAYENAVLLWHWTMIKNGLTEWRRDVR
jgi:hypothetical protein